jgi:hypothetical protein
LGFVYNPLIKRGIPLDNVGSGGSGGTTTYTNGLPTPVAVGGWEAGSTFASKTMKEMWDGLLYPYQYPAFSSFSISGQSTTLEVGDSTSANPTFLWATSNSSNVSTNTIDIFDVTGSAQLANNIANDGSESIVLAAITKTSVASHSFRIEGTNSKSAIFSRTYAVSWLWKKFYGQSANPGPLTEAGIEGLVTGTLSSSYSGSYPFGAGGYKYLCYPTTFGTATTFKDQLTQLDVAMETPYTITITNDFGISQSYRVHRTTNILGAEITIVVS